MMNMKKFKSWVIILGVVLTLSCGNSKRRATDLPLNLSVDELINNLNSVEEGETGQTFEEIGVSNEQLQALAVSVVQDSVGMVDSIGNQIIFSKVPQPNGDNEEIQDFDIDLNDSVTHAGDLQGSCSGSSSGSANKSGVNFSVNYNLNLQCNDFSNLNGLILNGNILAQGNGSGDVNAQLNGSDVYQSTMGFGGDIKGKYAFSLVQNKKINSGSASDIEINGTLVFSSNGRFYSCKLNNGNSDIDSFVVTSICQAGTSLPGENPDGPPGASPSNNFSSIDEKFTSLKTAVNTINSGEGKILTTEVVADKDLVETQLNQFVSMVKENNTTLKDQYNEAEDKANFSSVLRGDSGICSARVISSNSATGYTEMRTDCVDFVSGFTMSISGTYSYSNSQNVSEATLVRENEGTISISTAFGGKAAFYIRDSLKGSNVIKEAFVYVVSGEVAYFCTGLSQTSDDPSLNCAEVKDNENCEGLDCDNDGDGITKGCDVDDDDPENTDLLPVCQIAQCAGVDGDEDDCDEDGVINRCDADPTDPGIVEDICIINVGIPDYMPRFSLLKSRVNDEGIQNFGEHSLRDRDILKEDLALMDFLVYFPDDISIQLAQNQVVEEANPPHKITRSGGFLDDLQGDEVLCSKSSDQFDFFESADAQFNLNRIMLSPSQCRGINTSIDGWNNLDLEFIGSKGEYLFVDQGFPKSFISDEIYNVENTDFCLGEFPANPNCDGSSFAAKYSFLRNYHFIESGFTEVRYGDLYLKSGEDSYVCLVNYIIDNNEWRIWYCVADEEDADFSLYVLDKLELMAGQIKYANPDLPNIDDNGLSLNEVNGLVKSSILRMMNNRNDLIEAQGGILAQVGYPAIIESNENEGLSNFCHMQKHSDPLVVTHYTICNEYEVGDGRMISGVDTRRELTHQGVEIIHEGWLKFEGEFKARMAWEIEERINDNYTHGKIVVNSGAGIYECNMKSNASSFENAEVSCTEVIPEFIF